MQRTGEWIRPSESVAARYSDYARDVYRWAYRLLGRHHDALDVVQDVFLKWAAQNVAAPPKHPRGWLRRVTVNKALDMNKCRRTVTLAEPDALPAKPRDPAESSPAQRAEIRADVTDALDGLSDLQRGVLVAKVYDELTFAEIAEELGLAVSTVKTHYVRALQAVGGRLRARWENDHES